ncbi:hypothetical protein PO909_031412 [Leuciscus waleckii]
MPEDEGKGAADPREVWEGIILVVMGRMEGSRLDDQRCAPPLPSTRGPTVPDEDFFSLIMRSQAKRMDEQRVTLPSCR